MISSRKSKITWSQVPLSWLSFGRHYRMVNPCLRRIYLVVFKEILSWLDLPFPCFLNLEKTDSREFCQKNMPVFVVNLIKAQRIWPNLQKIYLETISLNKLKKFPTRISCLNKLQNLHLKSANLMAVKVFSLFAKAPGFSLNHFLRKPKQGAMIKVKKRSFKFKKEIYILTGRTKFFQENWSKLTSDKTVLQTISGLQIPFRSFPKLQKIIPVALPHLKEEYETLSQEIQSLKDKDAIREIPSTPAKFISRLFTVPKHSGETTCDKPCSSEQSHLQSAIQDGRFRKSQILTKPRGLFREDRTFGCLSIHFSPRRLTTIPGIYFWPGQICFQNDAIQAKRGTSSSYKSFQTSFGRSESTVYSSSHLARWYPSNLKFLFKLHLRSRHCYGPTSEPRFSIKHGKVSPHSNSESHLAQYGDRFVNYDIFSSRREGFSNCSKGNNSKEQESGIGKGNLPVYRNVLSYTPCSKGSSNPLSTASTPSDNLTDGKFTFKKPMLLSEIHASPPCPARSRLVDTQSFHLNFKSNYTSSSRYLHSDRCFRPGVGKLPETPKDFGNVDKELTFLAHKQKGINGNFSQSKVFPKIPRECPCSNNDRQLNKCVLSKPYGREKISHSFKSGTRNLEMVPTKNYPHFSSTCCRSSEHFRRFTVLLSSAEHRVDAMQENILTDHGSL